MSVPQCGDLKVPAAHQRKRTHARLVGDPFSFSRGVGKGSEKCFCQADISEIFSSDFLRKIGSGLRLKVQ